LPEAVEVGCDRAQWICYEVDVAKAGEYDVELFMNRPDYSTKGLSADEGAKEGTIRLCVDPADKGSAEWKLPASWNSGTGWRQPQKSVGTQRVNLPAGRHKLIMRFDDIITQFTFFCKLVFREAVGPGQ